MKNDICPKCNCEIKDKLDSESCWCDVTVEVKGQDKLVKKEGV